MEKLHSYHVVRPLRSPIQHLTSWSKAAQMASARHRVFARCIQRLHCTCSDVQWRPAISTSISTTLYVCTACSRTWQFTCYQCLVALLDRTLYCKRHVTSRLSLASPLLAYIPCPAWPQMTPCRPVEQHSLAEQSRSIANQAAIDTPRSRCRCSATAVISSVWSLHPGMRSNVTPCALIP